MSLSKEGGTGGELAHGGGRGGGGRGDGQGHGAGLLLHLLDTNQSHSISSDSKRLCSVFLLVCLCAGLTYCAMFHAFQEAVTEVLITLYKDGSRESDNVDNKQGFVSVRVWEIPSFHSFLA